MKRQLCWVMSVVALAAGQGAYAATQARPECAALAIGTEYLSMIATRNIDGAMGLLDDKLLYEDAWGRVVDKPALRQWYKIVIPRLGPPGTARPSRTDGKPTGVVTTLCEGNRAAIESVGSTTLDDGSHYENVYLYVLTVKHGKIVTLHEYTDTDAEKMLFPDVKERAVRAQHVYAKLGPSRQAPAKHSIATHYQGLIAARDIDGAMALLADNLIYQDPWGRTWNKAALQAWYRTASERLGPPTGIVVSTLSEGDLVVVESTGPVNAYVVRIQGEKIVELREYTDTDAAAVAFPDIKARFAPPNLPGTVLITGANSGIGLEFAKQYAALGWTVIATYRRAEVPDTLRDLTAKFPKVRPERMDVTSSDEVKALAHKLTGTSIDVLINNAGVFVLGGVDGKWTGADYAAQSFGTLDYRQFDVMMRTNVEGPALVTEAFAPLVEASSQKKIVAITSPAGQLTGEPRCCGLIWYATSKAALNKMMTQIAGVLKKSGVTVALLSPGMVRVEKQQDSTLPGLIETPESVTGMITTIGGLTLSDAGKYFQYDGKPQAW